MGSTPFTRARAQVAHLSRTLSPADPVMVAVRQQMREAFVVHKIAEFLGKSDVPLTAQMRVDIEALLDREAAAA